MSNETEIIIETMQTAALAAGEAILQIYHQQFTATQKADGTPVTDADQQAEKIILDYLAPLDIPVLAEESVAEGKIPELGDRFFVVDPLDGTKEFINKNHQFTVNIALVENNRPTCGIVTVPALNKGYIGSENGAFGFHIINGGMGEKTALAVKTGAKISMLISRSHADPRLTDLREMLNNPECMNVGSSLKMCLLACGKANLYPRFSPTCEWDIAAGQAVLEAAGGTILAANGGQLSYGKKQNGFRHPPFVAASTRELALRTCKLINAQI
ncbi:MAG: 3'(2'),5'-bisphosphate nucleotidase CysQ [Devosiaceae bacterium]|nr:3'(2'),5'-bisphosphate nucleotidase CysQ [Devosiaceae bacterium]